MRNQQLIHQGLGSIRILIGFIILLAIWHQCRGSDYDSYEKCSHDNARRPENCNSYLTYIRDCPKYFCYRKMGDICYRNDNSTKCGWGLTCSCNQCMNCMPNTTCKMDLCSNYSYKKRLPNRQIPWIYRGRLQSLSQKYLEPNYDN